MSKTKGGELLGQQTDFKHIQETGETANTTIVVQDTGETATIVDLAATPAAQLIAVLDRAINNPEVDADKLEKLMALQERILDRQARVEFFDALNLVKRKLPVIIADAENKQTNSRYATDAWISEHTDPVIGEAGFSCSFSQDDSPLDNHYRVVGKFSRGAHSEVEHVDVPADSVGLKGTRNKTDTHGWGSALTYGKVRLKKMFFDIPVRQHDDDGNAAGKPPAETITDKQETIINEMLDTIENGDAWRARIVAKYRIQHLGELPADQFEDVTAKIKEHLS